MYLEPPPRSYICPEPLQNAFDPIRGTGAALKIPVAIDIKPVSPKNNILSSRPSAPLSVLPSQVVAVMPSEHP